MVFYSIVLFVCCVKKGVVVESKGRIVISLVVVFGSAGSLVTLSAFDVFVICPLCFTHDF